MAEAVAFARSVMPLLALGGMAVLALIGVLVIDNTEREFPKPPKLKL